MNVDHLWIVICACFVFFMQAGFAMVETGFTRAKNACNIMMKNTMDYVVGSLAFWMVGFGLMFGAGTLSGLLGIGSGALKVIAMDQAMRLPFKVSSTTSNFMIGVTAAASAGVYLSRGYIDPGLAMPVVLGVLAGSFFGARFLASAGTRLLRNIFAGLVTVLAVEMIYNSLKGRI